MAVKSSGRTNLSLSARVNRFDLTGGKEESKSRLEKNLSSAQ
jgi:hypothetical protein